MHKALEELRTGRMIHFGIPKKDVINLRFNNIAEFMKTINKMGKEARQRVVITFDGYDHVSDEVYEIMEIRKWTQRFFEKYPYILYYTNFTLDTHQTLLTCIADIEAFYEGERLNAYELTEKYGMEERPKSHVYLSIPSRIYNRILEETVKLAIKNDDPKGADIVLEWMKRFK